MPAVEEPCARILVVAVLAATALAGGVALAPGGGDGPKAHTGTSQKGDFAEALGGAVAAAAKEMPCCDRILEWRLKEVAGEQGGIAGMNRLNVTIEAHVK